MKLGNKVWAMNSWSDNSYLYAGQERDNYRLIFTSNPNIVILVASSSF